MQTAIERQLFSWDEAAEIFGVSMWTVRRLVLRGHISSVYVGARRMISAEEIKRVVAVGVGAVPQPQRKRKA